MYWDHCCYDFPLNIILTSSVIIYADDTDVLVYNKSYNELMRELGMVKSHISEWF